MACILPLVEIGGYDHVTHILYRVKWVEKRLKTRHVASRATWATVLASVHIHGPTKKGKDSYRCVARDAQWNPVIHDLGLGCSSVVISSVPIRKFEQTR